MIISFIGAGHMAEALISRLTAYEIMASDIRSGRLRYLKRKYKVKVTANNWEAAEFGDVVILAVKPQNISEVLGPLSNIRGQKLVISIAAGIPLSYLQEKLPPVPIIRAMPNNPALVGEGITALAKGEKVATRHYAIAEKIFKLVGEVVEVPEKWMDAVTALSGSGPAFVYQVIEGLIQGGIRVGLPLKVAVKMALPTVIGAAKTIEKTGKSPQELTPMVASPGGTTIEGLKVLEKYHLVEALTKAVTAAAKKSKVLSQINEK